jgi:hypothetical protein
MSYVTRPYYHAAFDSVPANIAAAQQVASIGPVRKPVTVERLHQFMEKLARSVKRPGKIYFTGGATALLLGFRQQTIDVEVNFDPEPPGAFEAIAVIKNELALNWN